MTLQTPTRITIEVHHPDADIAGSSAFVRVVPEATTSSGQAISAEPREDVAVPAAFDPGECQCLDDADCNADHAND